MTLWLLLTDVVALAATFSGAYLLADLTRLGIGLPQAEYALGQMPALRLFVFMLVAAGLLAWLWLARQHYQRRLPFWDELRHLWHGLLFAALLDAAILYMVKLPFARLAWAFTWGSALLLLPLLRQLCKAVLNRLDYWALPTLIVGQGPNAAAAALALRSEHLLGYRIAAFVRTGDESPDAGVARLMQTLQLPLLADPAAMQACMKTTTRWQLVLALEPEQMAEQAGWIQQLGALDAELMLAPPLRGLPLHGTETTFFFSHEILFFRVRNNLARWAPAALKRLFDLVCASLGLLLLLPLFAGLIWRIRQDGGPAVFSHQRIGRDGRPFGCLKFRTMVVNAQEVLQHLLATDPAARAEWERDFKLKNDPRITPVGQFLRRTSLDELPQLWNVLRGDMSLVGPRPVIEAELARYGEAVRYYLEAKPGITGLWQVSGRSDLDYPQRVMLDTWYVQNWSLWHDIVILAKTVRVVLWRDGAY